MNKIQRSFEDECYINQCIASLKIGDFYKRFNMESRKTSGKTICDFYGKPGAEKILEAMCDRLGKYIEEILPHYFIAREFLDDDNYCFSIKCGGLTKDQVRRKDDQILIDDFFPKINNPYMIETYTNWWLTDKHEVGWIYLDDDMYSIFRLIEDQGANFYKVKYLRSKLPSLIGQEIIQQF